MKPSFFLVISIACGCAHAHLPPPVQYYDEGCLVRMPEGVADDVHGWEVFRGGHRVAADDLTRATADDPKLRDAIADAQHGQTIGMGTALAGGIVFAPGIGFLGAGLDGNNPTLTTTGAVLTAAGVVTLGAGLVLWAHASDVQERAVAAYNRERPASCRP